MLELADLAKPKYITDPVLAAAVAGTLAHQLMGADGKPMTLSLKDLLPYLVKFGPVVLQILMLILGGFMANPVAVNDDIVHPIMAAEGSPDI